MNEQLKSGGRKRIAFLTFSLRELLLLVLIVATTLGCWLDHRALSALMHEEDELRKEGTLYFSAYLELKEAMRELGYIVWLSSVDRNGQSAEEVWLVKKDGTLVYPPDPQ